jgi:hypothetical protein
MNRSAIGTWESLSLTSFVKVTYIVDQIDWMASEEQLLHKRGVPMPGCYMKQIALVDVPPVYCKRMFIQVDL